jgi:hypothetical protein
MSKRLLMFLARHTDTAAISATILVMVYAAGLAAQALEGSAFDACDLPRSTGSS